MTIIKTWEVEAHEIRYGQIELYLNENNELVYNRPYEFLDEVGQQIIPPDELSMKIGQRLTGSMAWANVPLDIQKALTQIDAFTKAEIKKKEGIT